MVIFDKGNWFYFHTVLRDQWHDLLAQAQMCMCWIIPADGHKCECMCDCWHARDGGFSVEPCYFQISVLEVQTIPNNNRMKPE